MNKVALLVGILFQFLTIGAFASSGEIWTLKSASCANGILNPHKIIEVGSQYLANIFRDLADTPGNERRNLLIETQKSAVMTVEVTGDGSGVCNSNEKSDILILVFSK